MYQGRLAQSVGCNALNLKVRGSSPPSAALPQGCHGLDAIVALLDRKAAKRCKSPESESSESSLSRVG